MLPLKGRGFYPFNMKYILKYDGSGKPSAKKIISVLDNVHAKIVDGSAMPELAVIELSSSAFDILNATMGPDWKLFEHKAQSVKVPTTRRKLAS